MLGNIPLLDLDLLLRRAVLGIVVAPQLIVFDWRPLLAIRIYFRWLRVVVLRVVGFQRRGAELLSNLACRFALTEPVGVRVPAGDVAALRAYCEVGPLPSLGIYLERFKGFVGPGRVQGDVFIAFKPAAESLPIVRGETGSKSSL